MWHLPLQGQAKGNAILQSTAQRIKSLTTRIFKKKKKALLNLTLTLNDVNKLLCLYSLSDETTEGTDAEKTIGN
jgi:hypothetical protein